MQNKGFLTEANYDLNEGNDKFYGHDYQKTVISSVTSTPLFRAVVLGDPKMVQTVIKHGDVSALNWCISAAMWEGNEEVLDILLQYGANPIAVDITSRTPFHYALYKGFECCLKLLIQACEHRGIQVSQALLKSDRSAVTPLHLAAANTNNKCLNVIVKYLQSGMIDPLDHKNRTPLHWAAYYSNYSCINALVRIGANCLALDCTGRTPLHWAVMAGRRAPHDSSGEGKMGVGSVNCIQKLLQEAPLTIGWRDHDGVSALHLATEQASPEVLETILNQSSCEVNITDNQFSTPVHWAAARGRTAALKLLVSFGGRIDLLDEHGATPLHYAACNKHIDTVRLLSQMQVAERDTSQQAVAKAALKGSAVLWAAAMDAHEAVAEMARQGVHLFETTKDGESWCPAFHVAASKGNINTVAVLLHLCNMPNSCDERGSTALHLAAYGGHAVVVKYLVTHGADLQQKDLRGMTALHCATLAGHAYVSQLILRARRDVNASDLYGRTCLHIAALKGYVELIALFIENKANLNMGDNQGRSALHCAASAGHQGALSLLLEAGAHHSLLQRSTGLTPLDYAVAGKHEDAAAALREVGALTGVQVREEAATAIQRAWRGQKRPAAAVASKAFISPLRSKSNAVIDSSAACDTGATGGAKGSATDRMAWSAPVFRAPKVVPLSFKGFASVRPNHSSSKFLSEGKTKATGGGGAARDVQSALLRAARTHSSCRELQLPDLDTLDLNEEDVKFSSNETLGKSGVPAGCAGGSMGAVHQSTNIAVAVVERQQPSTSQDLINGDSRTDPSVRGMTISPSVAFKARKIQTNNAYTSGGVAGKSASVQRQVESSRPSEGGPLSESKGKQPQRTTRQSLADQLKQNRTPATGLSPNRKNFSSTDPNKNSEEPRHLKKNVPAAAGVKRSRAGQHSYNLSQWQ